MVKANKGAKKTSDFCKFENLHIKEVAKKIKQGKVFAKSIKVKSNKHSYIKDIQSSNKAHENRFIFTPLNTDIHFEKGADQAKNHGV